MPVLEVSKEVDPELDPRNAQKHDLIASVAYALWESRRRRDAPDDPEADWFNAEQLVEDLANLQGVAER